MPLNSFGERGNYIFQLTNYYKTPINDLFSIQKSLCFYFRYLFATFGYHLNKLLCSSYPDSYLPNNSNLLNQNPYGIERRKEQTPLGVFANAISLKILLVVDSFERNVFSKYYFL